MADADKDGRAAQIVGDLFATTSMAVNEAVIEGRERMSEVSSAAGRITARLYEAEAERDHWEAEHAAIFGVVLSEDAAAAIAKLLRRIRRPSMGATRAL